MRPTNDIVGFGQESLTATKGLMLVVISNVHSSVLLTAAQNL